MPRKRPKKMANEATKRGVKRTAKQALTLHGLDPEGALRAFLQTDPTKLSERKKSR